MKKSISIRRLAVKILYKINPGDITIRHPYTNARFSLHSFRHKDYWYHRKSREAHCMHIFPELILPGDLVIDIGGHIGYISAYFAVLVGSQGQVIVFEPGANNLPYLRKNLACLKNVSIVEKAVTDYVGEAKFHLENLSGQNNSLIPGYRGFSANLESAGIRNIHTSTVDVLCTTLDGFLEESGRPVPAFVKVDVEGAEASVLKGMSKTLEKGGIALMVEVTENQGAIFRMLKERGFAIFNDSRAIIDNSEEMVGNMFCLRQDDVRISKFDFSG